LKEKRGVKMKKRKINYFLLLSLFFAIAVLIFIAGCDPNELPIVLSFLANPATIVEGESSTLSWNISVNSISITIDNGVGSVGVFVGETTVSPTKTTTYTITATNGAGTVTESVTVYVIPSASVSNTTLQPGPVEGMDALVSNFAPNINFGAGKILDVGNNDVAIVRSYFQFDLSSIPLDALMLDADLMLYQYDTPYIDENFEAYLFRVTGQWDDKAITWNSQPSHFTEAETSKTLIVGEKVWTVWDIKDLAQGWVNDPTSNYGCVLIDTDETSNNSIVYFHSSEDTTEPDMSPQLHMRWRINF